MTELGTLYSLQASTKAPARPYTHGEIGETLYRRGFIFQSYLQSFVVRKVLQHISPVRFSQDVSRHKRQIYNNSTTFRYQNLYQYQTSASVIGLDNTIVIDVILDTWVIIRLLFPSCQPAELKSSIAVSESLKIERKVLSKEVK